MLTAIFNLLGNIANLIIEGVVNIILKILDIVFSPIDSFINSILPDLSGFVSNLSRLFGVILQGPVSYFLSILNNFPYLKSAIRISISFDILFFTSIGLYYLVQGTVVLVSRIKAMIH